jgi:two-component system, OmpR family, sensor histidine kinase TctE
MTKSEPSLFVRLLVFVSLVLGFGAAVLMAAAWYSAREAADQAYDRLLLGAAYQIADAVTVQESGPEIELPVSAFELLSLSDRDRIFYRVIDPAGGTMTGYEDLPDPFSADTIARPELLQNAVYHELPVRVVRVSRTFDDPLLRGNVVVIVAQTVEARTALTHQLTLRSLFLVTIMGFIAIGGMVFAVRRALAPISRLEAAIRQRDPFNLTTVSTPAPRELAPFVAEINSFVERLRDRIEYMQQFIANAAHQLRTPLTALNGQVELLSNEDVTAQGRYRLERIQERTGQLARLANQLLSHAMVAHRQQAVRATSVNLVEVTRRALAEAIPDSTDRDVLVSLYPQPEPLVLSGDPVNIEEAIKNVVDNAMRHGASSEIRVRVFQKECVAVVEVEDDGPGIAPEKWPLVLQRFGMSSKEGRGSGLGLSIAAEVTAAHGGSIDFRHDGEIGFVVAMTFGVE